MYFLALGGRVFGHPEFDGWKRLALRSFISRWKKHALNTAKTQLFLIYLIEEQNFNFFSKPLGGGGGLQLECWTVDFAFKVLLLKPPSWSLAGRRRLWCSSQGVHTAAAERAKRRQLRQKSTAQRAVPDQEKQPGHFRATWRKKKKKQQQGIRDSKRISSKNYPQKSNQRKRGRNQKLLPSLLHPAPHAELSWLQTWLTSLEKNVNFDFKKIPLAAVPLWQQISFLWSIFIWLRMHMHIYKYFVKSRRILLSFFPHLQQRLCTLQSRLLLRASTRAARGRREQKWKL